MNTAPDCQHYKLKHFNEGRVLMATFSRAPVNAFVKECYEELSRIVDYVNKSPDVRVLLLNSDQKHFSAGADVNQLKKDANATSQVNADRRIALRTGWHDLHTCSVPVVVAVNGGAVGVGAAIAACGDVIFAEEEAFFAIPEIDIGLVGGAKSLSRLLPAHKIRALALTGKRVSAREVHQYGGVEDVVSRDKLDETALEFASLVAGKGAKAVRKWKEAFKLTEGVGIPEGAMIETALSMELN